MIALFKYIGFGIAAILIVGGLLLARFHSGKTTITTSAQPGAIRYLPLGDSYTIGESVDESQRWPNQLVARLDTAQKPIQIIDNPSVTGYTTQNLIDRELPLVSQLKPNFVTILIGVNDYVQGVDAVTFTQHLDYIISTVQKQLVKPDNLVLVTIPDYGKTPTGADFGSPQSAETGIKAFNAIITASGAKYNVPVADIFAVSQKVVNDSSLIAPDGLHPSGKQYTDWTNIIYQTLQAHNLPL